MLEAYMLVYSLIGDKTKTKTIMYVRSQMTR